LCELSHTARAPRLGADAAQPGGLGRRGRATHRPVKSNIARDVVSGIQRADGARSAREHGSHTRIRLERSAGQRRQLSERLSWSPRRGREHRPLPSGWLALAHRGRKRKPRSQRSVMRRTRWDRGYTRDWRLGAHIAQSSRAHRRSRPAGNRVNRAGAAPHGEPEPACGQPAISRSKPTPAVEAAFRLARALSRRLDHSSSARRPASVIRIRATLIFLCPTLTVSKCCAHRLMATSCFG
jgi:hypothetical protein